MAEKGFGVKEINLIGASGTPTIESPNNLNLNAVNVAISTNVSIGGTLTVSGNISIGGTLTYEDVTNIDSVGLVTAREGVFIPDNKELKIGNTAGSPDTKIFHNGSKTRLVSTVQYDMDADIIDIHNASANATKARFLNNQVELYYANNKKFETTSSGATVTGTLTATTFSGSGASLTNLPAANLTGTLPAISGANLTGIAVTEAPVTDYTITANGSSAYRFHGGGVDETANNPDLYLIRGQKYRFNNTTGSGHPFAIREASGGSAYSNGVTGSQNGIQFFTVPYDAPAKIFYQCTIHGGMVGNIYIRGGSGNETNVGVITATAFIPSSGQLAHRNLIINGAMNVAQRATSSTTDGYQTVDRWEIFDGGQDAAITREQVDVTSGAAYDAGFRKAVKVTNGNQTGGAGASDYIQIDQRIEAQNVAQSGWNYKSSSSNLTLSFYMKSSVAQAFSGSFRVFDGGSALSFKYNTPSISANTWTKFAVTIPGNSNITIDNDNGVGLQFFLFPFIGTTYTSSSSNTETWISTATSTYANDMTSTWWTTNGATFELTGVQLEVSPVATPYEHLTFAEELTNCQRYYIKDTMVREGSGYGVVTGALDVIVGIQVDFPVTMRATPSLSLLGTTYRTGGNTNAERISPTGFIWGRKQTGSGTFNGAAYATGGYEVSAEL